MTFELDPFLADVLYYVRRFPGSSKWDVRTGVIGDHMRTDRALRDLIALGKITDRGTKLHHKYYLMGEVC